MSDTGNQKPATQLTRGIAVLLVIAGLATALLGLLQQRTAEQIALNEADYAMRPGQ